MNTAGAELASTHAAQTTPEALSARKARVAIGSILASIVLSTIKMFVGVLSGSLALISDALQGFTDIAIGLITYHAVTTSAKPASPQYTCGRQKIEVVAALGESIILAGIALLIWLAGIRKLFFGGPEVNIEFWFIVVVMGAIVADYWRHTILRRAARETGSLALAANSSHFLADSLASVAVLFGLVFVSLGFGVADALATIVISVLLGFASYRVGRPALDVLLDKTSSADSFAVLELIDSEEEVQGVRDLRVRHDGQKYFVEAVVLVNHRLSVVEATKLSEYLASKLRRHLGKAEVIVGLAPAFDETSTEQASAAA
jgi:cation diffusion facilitator family transporter